MEFTLAPLRQVHSFRYTEPRDWNDFFNDLVKFEDKFTLGGGPTGTGLSRKMVNHTDTRGHESLTHSLNVRQVSVQQDTALHKNHVRVRAQPTTFWLQCSGRVGRTVCPLLVGRPEAVFSTCLPSACLKDFLEMVKSAFAYGATTVILLDYLFPVFFPYGLATPTDTVGLSIIVSLMATTSPTSAPTIATTFISTTAPTTAPAGAEGANSTQHFAHYWGIKS